MSQLYILLFPVLLFLGITFLFHRLLMKCRFGYFLMLSLLYITVSIVCLVYPVPDFLVAIVKKCGVTVLPMQLHGEEVAKYSMILFGCIFIAVLNIFVALFRRIRNIKIKQRTR